MSEKKPRIGPFTFLKQVRAEAGKVTWTTRKETQAATIMVLIMVVIAAAFCIVGWDWVADQRPLPREGLQ